MRWSATKKQKKQETKIIKLAIWHDWFAWYPVNVFDYDCDDWQWVWLEKIKRKGRFVRTRSGGIWSFEYSLERYNLSIYTK